MPNDLLIPSPDFADPDNDDIVDLLEIVKPGGNVAPQQAATGKEDDFSAEVDAMLGRIADAEKSLDAAAPSSPTPFPDPTPVDHAVDPDETLSMPSMDDFNNLLASLGADTSSAPQTPPLPGKSAPLPDLDALPLAGRAAPNVPLDLDFDAPAPPARPAPPPTPASGERQRPDVPQRAGETPDIPQGAGEAANIPQPAEETSGLPRPAPDALPEILLQEPEIPQEDKTARPPDLPAIESLFAENLPPPPPPLPDMETLFSRQIPDKPAPEGLLAGTARSPDAESLPAAAGKGPSARSPESKEPPPDGDSSAAPPYDGVDLKELDAILEDMLACAPPPGLPARESREEDLPAPPENRAPSPPDLAPLRQAVSRAETGLADLKEDLLGKNALIEKQQSRLAEQTSLIEELRHSLGSLRENVEAGLAGLKEELLGKNALIEKQQSRLAEQTSLIEELRHSLDSLRDNMDKMAALSAAKVIREELASLLKDGPPGS